MALDTTGVHTRRALLAGTVGGLAALAARALGQPAPVEAHDPSDVGLGMQNIATTSTSILLQEATINGDALQVNGNGSGAGLNGWSSRGSGVIGATFYGTGVRGVSYYAGDDIAYGVWGQSDSPNGIGTQGYVSSATGKNFGVFGYSKSTSGTGTVGWSEGSATGVFGYSGPARPIPSAQMKTAVYGFAPNGRGGVFRGGTAQLRLWPSTAATHPAAGAIGDLFVDAAHRLWFCKGDTTWVKLA